MNASFNRKRTQNDQSKSKVCYFYNSKRKPGVVNNHSNNKKNKYEFRGHYFHTQYMYNVNEFLIIYGVRFKVNNLPTKLILLASLWINDDRLKSNTFFSEMFTYLL